MIICGKNADDFLGQYFSFWFTWAFKCLIVFTQPPSASTDFPDFNFCHLLILWGDDDERWFLYATIDMMLYLIPPRALFHISPLPSAQAHYFHTIQMPVATYDAHCFSREATSSYEVTLRLPFQLITPRCSHFYFILRASFSTSSQFQQRI